MVIVGRVQSFLCVHVWLSIHQFVLSSVFRHTLQCCLKQVRQGEADTRVQVPPQPRRSAGRPRAKTLSIPIVLPLTSEVRCPSREAAPPWPTFPDAPDADSALSHPNMESLSRWVSPDNFKIITPFQQRSQSRLSPLQHYLCRQRILNISLASCSDVTFKKARLHSSRAKQVIPTVCVGDALEGEGEES